MSNEMTYNIDDCMPSIDYHYYVRITVINTDNLKKEKYSDYAHKREREREREEREGAGGVRKRECITHID
jgi:hypothetical protein